MQTPMLQISIIRKYLTLYYHLFTVKDTTKNMRAQTSLVGRNKLIPIEKKEVKLYLFKYCVILNVKDPTAYNG